MAKYTNKVYSRKPTLLWIGDAVAPTGFARVTHSVLDRLSSKYSVNVLGINYMGDPHPYKYPIWPAMQAANAGDAIGVGRTADLLNRIKPDIVCVLNDPWIIGSYLEIVKDYNKQAGLWYEQVKQTHPNVQRPKPVAFVSYTPVDARNVKPEVVQSFDDADHVVAYTNFGANEFLISGLTAPLSVIPHGNDSKVFKPVSKLEARKRLSLSPDWYIVGAVNRNQPRKKLDLTFKYFGQWAKDKPDNVRIYYHGSLKDQGWDIIDLARINGVDNRLIITKETMNSTSGVEVEVLRDVYNSFDVQISTTSGEGWGLTTMEGMACGVPQIVPDWSALGEWPRGAVAYVSCIEEVVHTGGINTIGGIASGAEIVQMLEHMYTSTEDRLALGKAGLALVNQNRFSWGAIARQFENVFNEAMTHANNKYQNS